MFDWRHLLNKKSIASLPRWDVYQRYLVIERFFSSEECEQILAEGERRAVLPAGIADKKGRPTIDRARRNAATKEISLTRDNDWLFERIESLVRTSNKKWYRFKTVGLTEDLLLITYQKGGHYVWHQDIGSGANSTRKLSVTVQLSEPLDYEGGDLQFFGDDISSAPKGQGALTLFPSFQYHRVLPITRGVRHALVGWVNGPHFR